MLGRILKICFCVWVLCFWLNFFFSNVQAYDDPALPDIIWDKLPKPIGDDGTEQLVWLRGNVLYIVKWLMVAVSVGYLTFYGFMYISSMGKEENITEQHDNLIWAVIGFAIIGLSNLAIDIFKPQDSGEVLEVDALNEGVMQVVVFVEYLLWAIAVVFMLMGAIRFIMAGGDESVMETEKKNFTWGFLGLIIIMIADTFIKLIYDQESEDFVGIDGTEQAIDEIFGVVNFVLAFMAVIAVLTIVIAGIYYVTAIGDEESTQKARRIITTTLLGFIIMSLAYVVVATFAR